MELEEELSARITDLLNFKLKREQAITVESMFMNKDVVVLLPTGKIRRSRSGGPGFESGSGHYLDLILGSPEFKSSATLLNSQLVCLRPVGILNNMLCSI